MYTQVNNLAPLKYYTLAQLRIVNYALAVQQPLTRKQAALMALQIVNSPCNIHNLTQSNEGFANQFYFAWCNVTGGGW